MQSTGYTTYTMRMAHAHIKVRHLARAADFYTNLLGLRITEQVGDHYLFLSSGNLHHEIALQSVGAAAPTPPAHGVGLYHLAFEVENKEAFAAVYRALRKAEVRASAVDHGISWALYFADPDGNGLEVYVDTRHDPPGADLWRGVSRPLPPDTILAFLSAVSA